MVLVLLTGNQQVQNYLTTGAEMEILLRNYDEWMVDPNCTGQSRRRAVECSKLAMDPESF